MIYCIITDRGHLCIGSIGQLCFIRASLMGLSDSGTEAIENCRGLCAGCMPRRIQDSAADTVDQTVGACPLHSGSCPGADCAGIGAEESITAAAHHAFFNAEVDTVVVPVVPDKIGITEHWAGVVSGTVCGSGRYDSNFSTREGGDYRYAGKGHSERELSVG